MEMAPITFAVFYPLEANHEMQTHSREGYNKIVWIARGRGTTSEAAYLKSPSQWQTTAAA